MMQKFNFHCHYDVFFVRDEGESSAAVIGSIIGGVVLILIIVITVFLIFICNKHYRVSITYFLKLICIKCCLYILQAARIAYLAMHDEQFVSYAFHFHAIMLEPIML